MYEANYTISNVWLGTAAAFFTPTATSQGDFNGDGMVDTADFLVWRNSMGQIGAAMAADGNGNNQIDAADYDVWLRHFGQSTGLGSGATVNFSSSSAVPEPTAFVLLGLGSIMAIAVQRRYR